MKKPTINQLREFAQWQKAAPAWRAYKKKWDNKIPRRGTKLFDEYVRDGEAIGAIQQAKLDSILGV